MRPFTAPSAINREAASLPSTMSSAFQGETSGPTETVIRPKGLRHGIFEAPKWAFWMGMSIVLVLAVVYALSRLGVLKLKRRAR